VSHTTKDLKKQLARIHRIKGQVEAIERALQGQGDTEQILQLVAACRGAMNGLMADLIEGHLRFHVLSPANKVEPAQLDAAEDLVAVVRRYFQ
jgi:FrmR/RcnR family transcriptional regulator, repressor of frmRAB operon